MGREKCALQTAVWGVGSGVMLGAACGLPPPPSSPGGASCPQHRPPAHWALGSSPNSGSFPRPPACCGPTWTLRCVLGAPPGHRASGTRTPSFLQALGSWRPPASLCAPPLLCRTMEIKQPWKSQRHPSPGHAKSESLKLSAGRGKTGPRTPVRGSRGTRALRRDSFRHAGRAGERGPGPGTRPRGGEWGQFPICKRGQQPTSGGVERVRGGDGGMRRFAHSSAPSTKRARLSLCPGGGRHCVG